MSKGLSGRRALQALVALLVAASLLIVPAGPARTSLDAATAPNPYTNPLQISDPKLGAIQSCGDPSVIRGQAGDNNWYMYCTADSINFQDKSPGGTLNIHLIPMLQSSDLEHWVYKGDAFTAGTLPSYARPGACLLAPDIHYFSGKYYLYYTVCDTKSGGSAVGVATSTGPLGPWTDTGTPVVEPHTSSCCPSVQRLLVKASVVDTRGQKYIFFGGVTGGISVRKLSLNGLRSNPASQKSVAIDNKYEAAFAWPHGGYWYLFVSDGSCCDGPLSSYGIKVGRTKSPTGPYVDQYGVPLKSARTGGTTVAASNGNRWVGLGGMSVFIDAGGRTWAVYQAVDRNDPYFTGTGTTKRPALMDPLDWVKGWPTLRGGLWASDTTVAGPASLPGRKSAYKMKAFRDPKIGAKISSLSDDFAGTQLSTQWTWVRDPGSKTAYLGGKLLNFMGCDCELYKDANNAPVLLENTPSGNYMVEAKIKPGFPSTGCCHNYAQAGLVIYQDDDNYIKLTAASISDTRQTEFAKEMSLEPRYDAMYVGPPGQWTYLRILKTTSGGEEL